MLPHSARHSASALGPHPSALFSRQSPVPSPQYPPLSRTKQVHRVPIFDSSSYTFSAYAAPVFLTALLMLAFGVRVMVRRSSRVSVAFFGISVACAVWLLAFTLMYSTREESIALFWAHIAYLGVPFIAPAVYQFTVEMLRINHQRRLETWQGWLLAAVISVIRVKNSLL